MWGGWLVTAGMFFSLVNHFHEYYLSMLASPLAVLVAVGVVQVWRQSCNRPWLTLGLLAGGGAITLAAQYFLVRTYDGPLAWFYAALICWAAALGLMAGAALWKRMPIRAMGYAVFVCALLLAPGAWSVLTMQNPSSNASLPSAYSGRSSRASSSLQVDEDLLSFIQANTQDVDYLMAVPSSMQGADYVIATGRPVLYLGGFKGSDQVVTVDELAQMVAQGELRYVYYSGRSNRGGQDCISTWVTANCSVVQGFDTSTQNAGAPDGTSTGSDKGKNLNISLYDCGGE